MSLRAIRVVTFACFAASSSAVLVSACVGDDPSDVVVQNEQDGSTTPPTGTQETGPAGRANGAECASDGQCSSAHCVDKVCCESTCAGTCERCNDPSALGKCSAIPTGQDPDSECPKPAPLDAGVDLDGALAVLVQPDGGRPSGDDSLCASKCDGARKCAFPGSSTPCGPKFCVDPTTQAAGTCDGAGSCSFGTDTCTGFGCPDGGLSGCGTTCISNAECQAGFYCQPGQGCRPTVALGTTCNSAAECKSGFCAPNKICCDSPCNANATDSCGTDGHCRCSACTTGPCAAWYPDVDKDGYGDRNAAPTYDCDTPTKTNFAKNNLDCFDALGTGAQVHPGATFHDNFYVGNNGNSWDWDCSGSEDKEFPSTTATGCRTCSSVQGLCSALTLRCTASSTTQSAHTCGKTKTDKCAPIEATLTAYREPVECGGSATLYTCGRCNGGIGPDVNEVPDKKQRCR